MVKEPINTYLEMFLRHRSKLEHQIKLFKKKGFSQRIVEGLEEELADLSKKIAKESTK